MKNEPSSAIPIANTTWYPIPFFPSFHNSLRNTLSKYMCGLGMGQFVSYTVQTSHARGMTRDVKKGRVVEAIFLRHSLYEPLL